jgi:hypothetical protein
VAVNKTLKIVLAANLIVLALLAFAYPHLMIAPGKLIPGHSKLETDCFACHAPFSGAATERCIDLPQAGGDRKAHEPWATDPETAHQHAFPPEAVEGRIALRATAIMRA